MPHFKVIKCYNQDEVFEVCLSLGIVSKGGLFHHKSDIVGIRIPDNKISMWYMLWKKGMGITTAKDYLKEVRCLP